jgi:hypothetical protein
MRAEPMVEPWPLALSYRHTAALRSLSLTSEERLSLIATPACFRSLGDVRAFLELLRSQNRPPPAAPTASQLLRASTAQWLAGKACGASALYKSGARPCSLHAEHMAACAST